MKTTTSLRGCARERGVPNAGERKIGALHKIASAVALAFLSAAGSAQAEQILFTFDCTIVNASSCTPGGPFGSLTLTDSIVDPNRVDLDLVVLPHAGVVGLNKFYLNYDGSVSLAGRSFRLVAQDAAPNTFVVNGVIGVNLNNLGPLTTTLDISLDPSDNILTYSGSLVLRDNLAPQTERDLDVSMFDLKDANNLLYAAFETVPLGTSLNAGATSMTVAGPHPPADVPEPGTLVLLAIAAGSLGMLRKRSGTAVAA